MHEKWEKWAIALQAIAQAGLTYGHDQYDKERYQAIREISAEILSEMSNLSKAQVKAFFCNETGYQTPKIDTRAAIFKDDAILLVHENNGTWSLPGGWCDVDQSIASNTIKEVFEETGLHVKCDRLIALQDWRLHNQINLPYGIIKSFMLCSRLDGHFAKNIETTGIAYFRKDALPVRLASEKSTKAQIEMCFHAKDDPQWKTLVD